MFFAAIALRYAFPISVYAGEGCVNTDGGRSVTMQSISSSLKVIFFFGIFPNKLARFLDTAENTHLLRKWK